MHSVQLQRQDLVTVITGLGFTSPSPPSLQVYYYYYYFYKAAWQAGSLLRNFFLSDYKGCVNKVERY